jgi:hypothetical protein
MEVRSGCDGFVHSLERQFIAFTGKVLVDGDWLHQAACGRKAMRRGAQWSDYFVEATTLVVHGDLVAEQVVDPKRQYSRKLLAAQNARSHGCHVHVVDAGGFAELLSGRAARCRRFKKSGATIQLRAEVGDQILGGPITHRKPRQHASPSLSLDLSALDRASQAHERTCRALCDALRTAGHEGRCAFGDGPRFDIGWEVGNKLFIAEIKSLASAREEQQIRLGLGQILDYAHQLLQHGKTVHPVLALERKPQHERWSGLARHHNVQLVWGPHFGF